MKLSIIVPSLDGRVPQSLLTQVAGQRDVEIVSVVGVSPVGKARNEGLKRAKGEWIAWVDSDDEVVEGWLEKIVRVISGNGSEDVITFDVDCVGWEHRRSYVWGVAEHEATADRLLRDLCREMERPSAPWLYVTRRRLWEGLRFDEEVAVAEDWLIMPQVLMRAKSCGYIPQKLYRYIHRESSLVNTLADEDRARIYAMEERMVKLLPSYLRRKRLWGMALNYFWGRNNRGFVRRHLVTLVGETVFGPDLTPGDRIRTVGRFVAFAMGWV